MKPWMRAVDLADQHLAMRRFAEAVAQQIGLARLHGARRLALIDRQLPHHGEDVGGYRPAPPAGCEARAWPNSIPAAIPPLGPGATGSPGASAGPGGAAAAVSSRRRRGVSRGASWKSVGLARLGAARQMLERADELIEGFLALGLRRLHQQRAMDHQREIHGHGMEALVDHRLGEIEGGDAGILEEAVVEQRLMHAGALEGGRQIPAQGRPSGNWR